MATIKVNGATKRGQELLARAESNQGTELRKIYGRWSDKKEDAMRDCRREYREDNGTDFRIISHCRDYFSVAWEYINEETGEIMTKIKTANHTYIIDGTRVSKEEE